VDPTAPPWRVLEDPRQPRSDEDLPAAASAQLRIPRSAVLAAGGAILLAMLAFLLAFSTSNGGTVVVDGGAPLGSVGVVGGTEARPDATPTGPDLVVEIVGAVDRPGVFRMAPGSRVGDLVNAAGGYGARVDTKRASRELNLAAPLHDGDQIRVPSRDDEETGMPSTTSGGEPGPGGGGTGLLDLNRATAAELEALPGIGPVTAGKILSSREEQPFATVDDLRTRKLLGEKTFEKLKDLVTVR
jgi:competence protein ComEA